MHFEHYDTVVIAVAALLDMEASVGTAHRMNDMRKAGEINSDMTVGQMAFAYTQFQQRKLLALNQQRKLLALKG